jgi:hypothetical protein
MAPQVLSLEDLPELFVVAVLGCLPRRSRAALRGTCKALRLVVNKNVFEIHFQSTHLYFFRSYQGISRSCFSESSKALSVNSLDVHDDAVCISRWADGGHPGNPKDTCSFQDQQTLEIGSCFDWPGTPAYTPVILPYTLARNGFDNVTKMDFSNCITMETSHLLHVLVGCAPSLGKISHMSLAGCARLDNTVFSALAALPKLQSLSLER